MGGQTSGGTTEALIVAPSLGIMRVDGDAIPPGPLRRDSLITALCPLVKK